MDSSKKIFNKATVLGMTCALVLGMSTAMSAQADDNPGLERLRQGIEQHVKDRINDERRSDLYDDGSWERWEHRYDDGSYERWDKDRRPDCDDRWDKDKRPDRNDRWDKDKRPDRHDAKKAPPPRRDRDDARRDRD